MDELTALDQLRRDLPVPTAETLAAIRTQLMERAAAPALAPTRNVPAGHSERRRPRRYVLAGVAAATVLALGGYALTATRGTSPSASPPRAAGAASATRAASPHSATPPTVAIPATYQNAAQLLTVAAATATRIGDPGPGQYRYVRSFEVSATETDGRRFEFNSLVNEIWQSGNGVVIDKNFSGGAVATPIVAQPKVPTRGTEADDLTWYATIGNDPQAELWPQVMRCADEGCYQPPASDSPWQANPPTTATLARLPRDLTALRASLLTWAAADQRQLLSYGKHFTVAELAFDAIGHQLDSGIVPAALRSALFEVSRTLPGIMLTGATTNFAGRPGIGISIPQNGGTTRTMIFDRTGNYIGAREVVVHSSLQWPLTPGSVVDWSALDYELTGPPTLPKGVQLPGESHPAS